MIKQLLTFSLLFSSWAHADKDLPQVADAFKADTDVIISAQPSPDDLKTLKEYGVKAVINSRTDAEMEHLDFNESRWLKTADMTYQQVAIGAMEPYSEAKLTAFNDAMMKAREQAGDEPILLHCRSGHRSSQLYAAWLVKYQGLTPDEALAKVKPAGWWPMPMQQLLGQKLSVQLAEPESEKTTMKTKKDTIQQDTK